MNNQAIYLTLCLMFFTSLTYGTTDLPDGSIAPNFKGTDLNGNDYELYDLLAQGKTVYLDFSTTWCGPCWTFKESGVYNAVHTTFGPSGSDEVVVLFIESDDTTTMDDLLGSTDESFGDWISGSEYPIIDDANIGGMYRVLGYPTVISVCTDRKIKDMGLDKAFTDFENNLKSCPDSFDPTVNFRTNQRSACSDLEVEFIEDSWPRATSWLWDFGDGNTSTEQNPIYQYENAGTYSVTLSSEGPGGSLQEIKSDYIKVGEGFAMQKQNVGPIDNNFGAGGMFQYGGLGLNFDVYKPTIIESVTMYSESTGSKTIAVSDLLGNVVTSRNFDVVEGKNRVDLQFYLDIGTAYRIHLQSSGNFYRHNSGASYPYSIDGLISITGNSLGIDGPYYFYYDWVVREAGCRSFTDIDEVEAQKLKVYPNPTGHYLTIEGDFNTKSKVSIVNTLGIPQLFTVIESNTNTINIDTAQLPQGLYYLKTDESIVSFVKKD